MSADSIDATDLADATTIAARLGVVPPAVHNWAKRHADFPAPVVDVPRHRLWDWADVAAWARETGRA